tara:strand:+ start:59 stop:379 length:321 start_codon:yes stop_codon:yes gene_type:complete
MTNWKDILKNEEFGPCEKQLITAYNKMFNKNHDLTLEGAEKVWGNIEDFLIEWDDKYSFNTHTGKYDPPAYKDHMTEDYTHPSLEEFRKLSDMYMSCIIKVGKHPV